MTPELSTRKHNLPAPVSSFIGREQELREIQQCLGENRLIGVTVFFRAKHTLSREMASQADASEGQVT